MKGKPKARNPKRAGGGAGPSGSRVSAFGLSAARPRPCQLDQLNFIPLWSVNKGDAAAVLAEMRAIGIPQAKPIQMPAEFLQVVHLEREVRQIRLHVHRSARRITAQFDQFFAARRL